MREREREGEEIECVQMEHELIAELLMIWVASNKMK